DIARRPVALHQQAADQVTRRAVVAHHLVDERLAVTTAVAVYVIELGVDPHIAAARIPTEAEILRGGGAGSGQRGNRSREREHPGLEQARVGHAWIGYGMVGHGFSCLQCHRWLRRNRRAGAVNTCRTRIRAVQQGRTPSHGQREITNLPNATPRLQPSPLPANASDTSPLVMTWALAALPALAWASAVA